MTYHRKMSTSQRLFSMNSMGDNAIEDPNGVASTTDSPGEISFDNEPPEASADPQTAYTACLRGGGSFGSCNQIPGVTPEMIAAAKSAGMGKRGGGGVASAGSAAVGILQNKALLIALGGGLLYYLLTKKK